MGLIGLWGLLGLAMGTVAGLKAMTCQHFPRCSTTWSRDTTFVSQHEKNRYRLTPDNNAG